MSMASSSGVSAVQAFSKHEEALFAALGDPEPLASDLFAGGVISSTVRDRAASARTSLVHRKKKLLEGIKQALSCSDEAQPSTNNNMAALLEALRGQPEAEVKALAKELSKTFSQDDVSSGGGSCLLPNHHRLGPEVLTPLSLLLAPAAYQWRQLAMELGFREKQVCAMELHYTEASCLERVLQEWLEWTPPSHTHPTVEALTQALRSIRLYKLAYDVEYSSFLVADGPTSRPLHPRNLGSLQSVLDGATAALDWRELGDKLGFLTQELEEIRATSGLTHHTHFLQELLRRWLGGAPPKRPFPTARDLTIALRALSQERLAYDLEQAPFITGKVEDDPVHSGDLHPRDLPVLFPLLLRPLGVGVAQRWRDLGLKLGFTVEEIKDCQAGLFQPQHCFQELLRRWLNWTPPVHRLPQLKDLLDALESLGLSELVSTLQEKGGILLRQAVIGSQHPVERHRLHSTHLPRLCSLLKPLSGNWRELGQRLGFVERELQGVECTSGLFQDAEYLQELLRRWVNRGPPRSFAHQEDLMDALLSMGEGHLAYEVQFSLALAPQTT